MQPAYGHCRCFIVHGYLRGSVLLKFVEKIPFTHRLVLAASAISIGLLAMVVVGMRDLSSARNNVGFASVFAHLLEGMARLETELEAELSGKHAPEPPLSLAGRHRDVLRMLAGLHATAGAGPEAEALKALEAGFGIDPAAERERLGLAGNAMPADLRALWSQRDMAGRTLPDSAAEFLGLTRRIVEAGDAYTGEHDALLASARSLSHVRLFPALRQGLERINRSAARTAQSTFYVMTAGVVAVLLSLAFGAGFILLPMYREVLGNQAHLASERDSARASERENREFLAMMSHEMRTPMNGLLGFATLLEGTSLDARQREYVGMIRESSQGLMGLLNNILDLSRMEMGLLQLDDENLSLADIVADVVAQIGPQAAGKRLDLSAYVDPALPGQLRGDGERIRQILAILLGNAIKFTVGGSVGVEVRYESGDDERGHVVFISVSDTGTGIARDQLSRIFDRFTQVDSSSSRRFEGSGLGLPICQELVRLMDGWIGVESTPDKGSTFSVRLRLKSAQPPASAVAETARQTFARRRFLVVDDNPVNRRIFRLQLEGYGAEVECVPDAAAALAALAQGESRGCPYDLAIIDQTMPGIDGLTLRRMIRDKPQYAGLKLVIASSDGIGYDQQARVLGFDAACPKPVVQEKLVSKIQELIRPSAPPVSEVAIARLPTKTPAPVAPPDAPERQARLLIAEDNPINQRLISAALKHAGFSIVIVGDGVEAVHAVKQQPYDLVLMDIRMPVMNGVEATRRIRALPGDMACLPIIAMTANAMPGDREEYLEAGMNDYVAKPIDFNILLAKIRAHLPIGVAETVAETADIVTWKPEKLRG